MDDTYRTAQVAPAMRVLLTGAAALVILAGIPLFFFSEQTERYFAWTIQPPLTAAFLGAGYWSVGAAVVMALREREWTRMRVIMPAVTIGVSLILLASLLHLDRFHLNSPIPTARGWAWAWLILYVLLVLSLVAALWQQRRQRERELPRQRELPVWLRYAIAVLGFVLLAIGIALILAPAQAGALWPWMLTPLTGRMTGAWLTAIGIAMLAAARENDYARIYVAAATGIVYAGLQFVNLVRYPGTVEWSRPGAWLYVALLLVLAVVSAASLRGYLALRSVRAGQPHGDQA